jgi:hypothetical protein
MKDNTVHVHSHHHSRREDSLGLSDVNIEAREMHHVRSNLSIMSNNAVVDEFDEEQAERQSEYDIGDPKEIGKISPDLNKQSPNSKSDELYKIHFRDLGKPVKNLKISFYKSKKEDQYKRIVANEVLKQGKYDRDKGLLEQITSEMKDCEELNICEKKGKSIEFQKLTDIDIFFLRNYFNVIALKLDHHTIDFQEDLYRDDNNVFKRVP